MTPAPCARNDHVEWANWRDDGRVIALICTVCGATAPPPVARADRKLEARIGELLPREQGKRTDLISTDNLAGVPAKLTRTERREFRQIAEYQDHPEVEPGVRLVELPGDD